MSGQIGYALLDSNPLVLTSIEEGSQGLTNTAASLSAYAYGLGISPAGAEWVVHTHTGFTVVYAITFAVTDLMPQLGSLVQGGGTLSSIRSQSINDVFSIAILAQNRRRAFLITTDLAPTVMSLLTVTRPGITCCATSDG